MADICEIYAHLPCLAVQISLLISAAKLPQMGDWTEGYTNPTNMHRGHKKLAMTCPGFASFAEAKVVKSPKYLVGPVLIFSMSPTSFSAFHVLAVCTLHFMRPQRLAVNTFNFCPICDLLCSNFWQRCQQTSTSRLFCNFPVFCTRAAIQILQHQKVCLRGTAYIHAATSNLH